MSKIWMACIASVFFLLGAANYAKAAKDVTFDGGGNIFEYIEKYNDVRKMDGKLVIDGACLSACTMFLGTVPAKNVCATEYGFLGFHSASQVNPFSGERKHSPEGTKLLWQYYPENVREALRLKGFDGMDPVKGEHPDFVYFKATEFVKPCEVR